MIVFTVNEHRNICIAGLNRRAGYATAHDNFLYSILKNFINLRFVLNFFNLTRSMPLTILHRRQKIDKENI